MLYSHPHRRSFYWQCGAFVCFSRFIKCPNKYLVTLGITPTYPATGYGYIEFGQSIGQLEGVDVFQALKFKEKPTEELAANFISRGDHAWNSGMFIWQVQDILAEFARQMPALSVQLQTIAEAWGTPQREAVLQQIWREGPDDYGIAKAPGMRLFRLQADWNDVAVGIVA
jgi:mannose-1-phosphate guanylyltransferase